MQERLYFLGVGGTLMGGLARIAKEAGYQVSGSDKALYPPMSDQLAQADITLYEGFDPAQLDPPPDLAIIGNAQLGRGHPGIEHILNKNIPHMSGAQWLGDVVLRGRWVIAVAGTHGKTTTASMVAWILEYAGLAPGYMIGGVPRNFDYSARLGQQPFFVVEADEYDTSYFDRRSKFMHYRPRTLIIHNLEYDHADIFDNLRAIQTQFHHLVRSVPGEGLIIAPTGDRAVNQVLGMGCWTPVTRCEVTARRRRLLPIDSGDVWHTENAERAGSAFDVSLNRDRIGRVTWDLMGEHNVRNALAAIAAARHAGVPADCAVEALCYFKGVKRRLELIAERDNVKVYDDFAHHPTAIRATLQGLRDKVGAERILAVIEPRTHTMSLGSLRSELSHCCAPADEVIWFRGENIQWDLNELIRDNVVQASVEVDIDHLVARLARPRTSPCHIVIMSNGNFGGVYAKLAATLAG